jgi:hypothetical protein
MKALTAGTCAFFLAVAAMRAARVPLTYDEASSYIRYIDTSFPTSFDTGLLSVFNFEVATNHFLNTLLTKICWFVAGGSELVIRLPNLFGYATFICCSWLVLRRISHPFIAFAGFLLLNLNPYVLDFFTLSRGYGLSLGFLMGAILFLFRFLERLPTNDGAGREASRALACALGAVMANFALLNVYLAVYATLLVALAISHYINNAPSAAEPGEHSPARRPFSLWLPVVAAIFTALVLSQDVQLSDTLYEPVAVSLLGLDQSELDRATVVQVDIRGRHRRLRRDAGATTWHSNPGAHFRAVAVELPSDAAGKLGGIEVIIGKRSFSSDVHRGGAWTVRDDGRRRVFESETSLSLPRSRIPQFHPVMNWAGDARYAARLAAHTAFALGILAALAVAVTAVGWLAVRARVLSADRWRPLASGALWAAALAGTPLYLLKRNGALIFGGTRGLVEDTFYSTIESSFYSGTYHPAQTQIVFAGILATLAIFCVVLYASYRRRQLPRMLPATGLVTIIVMTSVSLVAQRILFDTLYLAGRTALFYIPLYVLFVTFLADTIAKSSQVGKALAIAVLAAGLAFSGYHFMATANMTYAWDWREDASTKTMMADLAQIVAAERPRGPRVVLEVDPKFIPVATYYAHRTAVPIIDVVVPPSSRGIDFLYVDEKDAAGRPNVIRTYPFTSSALVRIATTAQRH